METRKIRLMKLLDTQSRSLDLRKTIQSMLWHKQQRDRIHRSWVTSWSKSYYLLDIQSLSFNGLRPASLEVGLWCQLWLHAGSRHLLRLCYRCSSFFLASQRLRVRAEVTRFRSGLWFQSVSNRDNSALLRASSSCFGCTHATCQQYEEPYTVHLTD